MGTPRGLRWSTLGHKWVCPSLIGVHEKRFIEARRLVDGVLCLICGGAELEEMAGLPKRIIKVRLADLLSVCVRFLKRKKAPRVL